MLVPCRRLPFRRGRAPHLPTGKPSPRSSLALYATVAFCSGSSAVSTNATALRPLPPSQG